MHVLANGGAKAYNRPMPTEQDFQPFLNLFRELEAFPASAVLTCIRAVAAFLIFALAPAAFGQNWHAYIVAGAGSLDSKLISHAAMGGEVLFGKGFGAGAEIGVIAGHTSFAAFSANGYYHISNPNNQRKLDSFITGGYTGAADLFSTAHIGNVGGGLHYWLVRHFGLRAEFRDFVSGGGQTPVFRGGIAFR